MPWIRFDRNVDVYLLSFLDDSGIDFLEHLESLGSRLETVVRRQTNENHGSPDASGLAYPLLGGRDRFPAFARIDR